MIAKKKNATWVSGTAAAKKRNPLVVSLRKYWQLYLLLVPVILYYIIFQYAPMYGVQIAFKDYSFTKGIMDSPWVGFKHFIRYFKAFDFWRLLWNTVSINIYQLVIAFPAPIILALLINEVRSTKFKKTVQMVTYAPHFLSVVVMVSLINSFCSPTNGLINMIIQTFGGDPIYFMAEPGWFKTIFVFSGIWQHIGWGTIIYLATLSSIDPSLYEAAVMDGASKLKRLLYITLPFLIPIITIQLIMEMGRIMQLGFEKVLLMQNTLNISSSEVISTYIYKKGLVGSQFSFSSAVGLFNSLVNCTMLVLANKLAKKAQGTSLW